MNRIEHAGRAGRGVEAGRKSDALAGRCIECGRAIASPPDDIDIVDRYDALGMRNVRIAVCVDRLAVGECRRGGGRLGQRQGAAQPIKASGRGSEERSGGDVGRLAGQIGFANNDRHRSPNTLGVNLGRRRCGVVANHAVHG